MKHRAIITYLLAFALLLSACVYRIPDNTQGSSEPALQESGTTAPSTDNKQPTKESESTPAHSDTSPSFEFTEDPAPTGTPDGTEEPYTPTYLTDPSYYQYITVQIGDDLISGMALSSCPQDVLSLVIPSYIDDVPVVAIGEGNELFEFNSAIKSVVIPETVRYIGENAFRNCSNLTDLTLPSNVQYIGWNAFRNCTSLTDLTLPSSVQYIGGLAFGDCPGLKEIRITPDMTLDYQALMAATGLQTVIIDEGVTLIPFFTYCSSLTEITLPSTITALGTDGTEGNEPHFYGTQITFIEIPEGVTYLGWYVFQKSGLESIVLPSTLKESSMDTFATDTLKYVFFRGTEDQLSDDVREDIYSPSECYTETIATIYYYSEEEPTKEGNFWHYVDGKPVIW